MPERIVDACCIINLYGSRRPLDILEAVGGLCVTQQVSRESLSIRVDDPEEPYQQCVQPLDLQPAIDRDLLSLCELMGAEFELMIQFARELDDGEASSLALAKSRGWKLATDDKKARRIAVENDVKVVSTSELLHQWATATEVSDNEIAAVLNSIQRYARFTPPRSDPLLDWWRNLVSFSNK